ncbi:hypothetical protein HELRODRAFT_180703 [Helobdella robusta]|uniref:CABIT domain-containing protein n=1 Tax=Helobdella robusta TaxID=6412 RepID=T1FG69_HELRO|nr:hypothetical protein HELRODRAFT_180703 [Helobdella robusta]ESN93614.1 hypothetical protein HELRODRAFT_180703 [Helobdella robusta]
MDMVNWEGEFTMPEFITCFSKNLPVLIRTLSGLMGVDDLHIVGGDEIYWIYDIQRQKRVVASMRDKDKYCTIPIEHPAKFHVFVYVGNARQLQHILNLIYEHRKQNVYIECENNDKMHFQVGSESGHFGRFGSMEVLDTYDEKYLLGYPICLNKINARTCGIPVYLDIELTAAVGFVNYPVNCFTSWLSLVNNIVKTFPRAPVTTCQEIIIFPRNPEDSAYEYINPLDNRLSVDAVKSDLKDISKGNTYVIHPPPRLNPSTEIRIVELPAIPKSLPPLPNEINKRINTSLSKSLPPLPETFKNFDKKEKIVDSPKPNSDDELDYEDISLDVCKTDETDFKKPTPTPPKIVNSPKPNLDGEGYKDIDSNVCKTDGTNPKKLPPILPKPPKSPPVKLLPEIMPRSNSRPSSTSSTSPSPNNQQKISVFSKVGENRDVPCRPDSTDIRSYSIADVENLLRELNMDKHIKQFNEKQSSYITECLSRIIFFHCALKHNYKVDGELLSCLDQDLLEKEFNLSRFESLKLTKYFNGWRPSDKK